MSIRVRVYGVRGAHTDVTLYACSRLLKTVMSAVEKDCEHVEDELADLYLQTVSAKQPQVCQPNKLLELQMFQIIFVALFAVTKCNRHALYVGAG